MEAGELGLRGVTRSVFFEALDFSFDDLADERSAALPADKRIDPLAQTLRQAHLRRSYSERRSSHSDSPIRTTTAFNGNEGNRYRLLTEKPSGDYKRYRLLILRTMELRRWAQGCR